LVPVISLLTYFFLPVLGILANAFLQQTELGFGDIARLRIRDVYGLGITVQVGFAKERIVALNGPHPSRW
jgi:hypothetical protein